MAEGVEIQGSCGVGQARDEKKGVGSNFECIAAEPWDHKGMDTE